MNDRIKKLLQYVSDHVVSTGYRDDNGDYNYRVEGLELSSQQVADLDELFQTADISDVGTKGGESGKFPQETPPSPWITSEEPENTPVMFSRITGINTFDPSFKNEISEYSIFFDTLDGPKIWTFETRVRRNEVYTLVYNRLDPEVL